MDEYVNNFIIIYITAKGIHANVYYVKIIFFFKIIENVGFIQQIEAINHI